MEQIARPYLIYELTGSPLQLGGVIVARTLPQFGFGILAGVMIDWFDRKLVLQLSQYGALLLNVVFAALLIFGLLELWHIYAAAAVRGTTMAFDQPARQALLPAVVPANRVTNADCAVERHAEHDAHLRHRGRRLHDRRRSASAAHSSRSPLIYVGAVVPTALLRVATHIRPPESGAGAMLAGLGDAMRYALGTPAIRGAISLALIHFAFGLSFLHLFAALFALEVLDIGPFGFGIMMSITGLGSLTGALIIASRSPRRLGRLLPLMMAAMGVLLLAFALSTYVPGALGRRWVVLPLLLVFGVGLFQSGIFALVQVVVLDAAPDQMRGRLMGLLAFDRATMLMGAAAGGVIAEAIGVQRAQIVYATLVVIGALAIFAFAPRFRRTVIGASVPTAEPGSRSHTAAGVRSARRRAAP